MLEVPVTVNACVGVAVTVWPGDAFCVGLWLAVEESEGVPLELDDDLLLSVAP